MGKPGVTIGSVAICIKQERLLCTPKGFRVTS